MSDPFPIVIDVDEDHVGKVLRTLDGMPGVLTIGLFPRGKNGPRPIPVAHPVPNVLKALAQQVSSTRSPLGKPRTPSADMRVVIARAIGSGAVHLKMLQKVVERAGMAPNSTSATLTKMIAEKHVKRVGAGIYRLTAMGVNKYSKHDTPMQTTGLQTRKQILPNNKRGVRLWFLRTLQDGAIPHLKLKDKLLDEGFADNNIYSLMPKMIQEGLIRRGNDGYELTDRGMSTLGSVTGAPIIEAQANEHISHGDNE